MMKKSILSLVVMMVIGCTMAFGAPNYTKRPDWMKYLNENTPVCRLCIPGVHDGGTGRVHVHGCSVQTLTVEDLFDVGVRAFDIRVGYTSQAAVKIYHGGMDMAYEFSNLMDRLYNKLDEHDQEFIIVIINIEHATTSKGMCKTKLRSYFIKDWNDPHREDTAGPNSYIYWGKGSEDRFTEVKKKWAVFNPKMTVKDARGKVIFMFRTDYTTVEEMPGVMLPGFGASPEVSSYQYYDGFALQSSGIIIQDAYHDQINGEDIEVKFRDYVVPTMKMITSATQNDPDSYIWCINHLSGYTNHACAPNSEYLASITNRAFNQYLAQNPELYTGIVMMDYAGETTSWGYNVAGSVAVDAVIHQNHRYWNPIKGDHRKHYEPNSN